ncbi:MAG: MBOAT family protein, partial [Byssovorax sp.]
MLFNSRPFLLAFLPLTLLFVLGLRHLGRRASAKVALIGASLFFYGWWSPKYLVLLVGLLAFNYGVARFLLRAGTAERPSRMRAPVFVFG